MIVAHSEYSMYTIYTNHLKALRHKQYLQHKPCESMKTLRISEDIHQKLTTLLGELMAQTSKMQTYQDAINALINESVILPEELLTQIQNFMEENKQLGFTTREEFIRDAIRFRLTWFSQENEYVEIPREQYDLLNEAIKEMNTSYRNVEDFINIQIKEALAKYEEWKQASKYGRLKKE
jgi:Arc/MetJ-type ribon-helix-helix transcriptional regulator